MPNPLQLSRSQRFAFAGGIFTLLIALAAGNLVVGRARFKQFCTDLRPGISMRELDRMSDQSGYNFVEGIDGPSFIAATKFKPHALHTMFCNVEFDDITARQGAKLGSSEFSESIDSPF